MMRQFTMGLGHVKGLSEVSHAVDVEGYRSGIILRKVPVMGTGFWLPQIGDTVVIAYLGASDENPIIMGRLLEADHGLNATNKDDIHIHRIVRNEDGDATGEIEVNAGSNGDLNIMLSGLKGNLNIHTRGEDGNINLYGNGNLKVGVNGDAVLHCGGNVRMEAMKNAEIDCDGDISLTTRGKASISTEGDTEINSAGKTSVQAEGEVQVDGEKVVLGKNLSKHPANNLSMCLFTGAPHIAPENNPDDHIVEI